MADVRLIDPLGREWTLHERTWVAHILRAHPEIEGHRALAEQTIKTPLEIRVSQSDVACRLYYGQGPRSELIMMVVADVSIGVVKTAHLCRKITGGAIEWASSPTASKE